MIGFVILSIVLLAFAVISTAIIYHLWLYGPEKKQSIALISVYIFISFILILFTFISFGRINWRDMQDMIM